MSLPRNLRLSCRGTPAWSAWLGSRPTASRLFPPAKATLSFGAANRATKVTVTYRTVISETYTGAGGSVENNVSRWIGQFDGVTKEKAKRQETKIAGQKVYLVDISGTYKDSPGGPFAGAKPIPRENYRMLGAIITTEKNGNYFLKFYGPKATVDKNEEAFTKMVDSLKVK